MAIINDDYNISRLTKTFYRISKKNHLFKDDTYEHFMSINGVKKSLGISYSYNNSLTYKWFVSLLNSYPTMDALTMERMVNTPKIKNILSMLNCLNLKQIIGDAQTSSPTFIFINDGTWHLNGHSEVEIYKEEGNLIQEVSVERKYCTFSFKGKFEMEDLCQDEYRFLVNYIRVFYLINLPWMIQCIGFPIGIDTSCILRANNKGWV